MTSAPPRRAPLPEGQEQVLRALSSTMFRAAATVGLGTSVVAVALAGLLAGAAGALSAAVGAVLVLATSAFTLALMRRTASLAPSAVMTASLGGFLVKMTVLPLALFGIGGIDGVHRQSLALTMLALFIVVAAAEVRAGRRMPTLSVEPGVTVTTGATAGPVPAERLPSPAVDGVDGAPPVAAHERDHHR